MAGSYFTAMEAFWYLLGPCWRR